MLEVFEVEGFFNNPLSLPTYPISKEINILKSRQRLTLRKCLTTGIANFIMREIKSLQVAENEGTSMHEVALTAIDEYISKRQKRLKDAISRIATEDAELLDRLSK